MSEHVFGDRCLGNVDSEFEQLAMYSRGSPEKIISAHGADEFANILRNPRSSRFTMTTFPSPKQSVSLAMPTNDCFRFNNDER
jgi:hypothetical protein